MPKCPYCARPLRGAGIKCRACRRYVLRWPHWLLLSLFALAALALLLDALFRIA
ncbi:MAG: hypothetical protein ACR2GW_01205 [Pyrinomonadaceae bacterium]|nr:hypothetical protein [Acidobacteriota bacterium]